MEDRPLREELVAAAIAKRVEALSLLKAFLQCGPSSQGEVSYANNRLSGAPAAAPAASGAPQLGTVVAALKVDPGFDPGLEQARLQQAAEAAIAARLQEERDAAERARRRQQVDEDMQRERERERDDAASAAARAAAARFRPANSVNPMLALASELRDLLGKRASAISRLQAVQKSSITTDRLVRRLPEPTHRRTHWDALMGEMLWLVHDMVSERRWKIVACAALASECAAVVLAKVSMLAHGDVASARVAPSEVPCASVSAAIVTDMGSGSVRAATNDDARPSPTGPRGAPLLRHFFLDAATPADGRRNRAAAIATALTATTLLRQSEPLAAPIAISKSSTPTSRYSFASLMWLQLRRATFAHLATFGVPAPAVPVRVAPAVVSTASSQATFGATAAAAFAATQATSASLGGGTFPQYRLASLATMPLPACDPAGSSHHAQYVAAMLPTHRFMQALKKVVAADNSSDGAPVAASHSASGGIVSESVGLLSRDPVATASIAHALGAATAQILGACFDSSRARRIAETPSFLLGSGLGSFRSRAAAVVSSPGIRQYPFPLQLTAPQTTTTRAIVSSLLSCAPVCISGSAAHAGLGRTTVAAAGIVLHAIASALSAGASETDHSAYSSDSVLVVGCHSSSILRWAQALTTAALTADASLSPAPGVDSSGDLAAVSLDVCLAVTDSDPKPVSGTESRGAVHITAVLVPLDTVLSATESGVATNTAGIFSCLDPALFVPSTCKPPVLHCCIRSASIVADLRRMTSHVVPSLSLLEGVGSSLFQFSPKAESTSIGPVHPVESATGVSMLVISDEALCGECQDIMTGLPEFAFPGPGAAIVEPQASRDRAADIAIAQECGSVGNVLFAYLHFLSMSLVWLGDVLCERSGSGVLPTFGPVDLRNADASVMPGSFPAVLGGASFLRVVSGWLQRVRDRSTLSSWPFPPTAPKGIPPSLLVDSSASQMAGKSEVSVVAGDATGGGADVSSVAGSVAVHLALLARYLLHLNLPLPLSPSITQAPMVTAATITAPLILSDNVSLVSKGLHVAASAQFPILDAALSTAFPCVHARLERRVAVPLSTIQGNAVALRATELESLLLSIRIRQSASAGPIAVSPLQVVVASLGAPYGYTVTKPLPLMHRRCATEVLSAMWKTSVEPLRLCDIGDGGGDGLSDHALQILSHHYLHYAKSSLYQSFFFAKHLYRVSHPTCDDSLPPAPQFSLRRVFQHLAGKRSHVINGDTNVDLPRVVSCAADVAFSVLSSVSTLHATLLHPELFHFSLMDEDAEVIVSRQEHISTGVPLPLLSSTGLLRSKTDAASRVSISLLSIPHMWLWIATSCPLLAAVGAVVETSPALSNVSVLLPPSGFSSGVSVASLSLVSSNSPLALARQLSRRAIREFAADSAHPLWNAVVAGVTSCGGAPSGPHVVLGNIMNLLCRVRVASIGTSLDWRNSRRYSADAVSQLTRVVPSFTCGSDWELFCGIQGNSWRALVHHREIASVSGLLCTASNSFAVTDDRWRARVDCISASSGSRRTNAAGLASTRRMCSFQWGMSQLFCEYPFATSFQPSGIVDGVTVPHCDIAYVTRVSPRLAALCAVLRESNSLGRRVVLVAHTAASAHLLSWMCCALRLPYHLATTETDRQDTVVCPDTARLRVLILCLQPPAALVSAIVAQRDVPDDVPGGTRFSSVPSAAGNLARLSSPAFLQSIGGTLVASLEAALGIGSASTHTSNGGWGTVVLVDGPAPSLSPAPSPGSAPYYSIGLAIAGAVATTRLVLARTVLSCLLGRMSRSHVATLLSFVAPSSTDDVDFLHFVASRATSVTSSTAATMQIAQSNAKIALVKSCSGSSYVENFSPALSTGPSPLVAHAPVSSHIAASLSVTQWLQQRNSSLAASFVGKIRMLMATVPSRVTSPAANGLRSARLQAPAALLALVKSVRGHLFGSCEAGERGAPGGSDRAGLLARKRLTYAVPYNDAVADADLYNSAMRTRHVPLRASDHSLAARILRKADVSAATAADEAFYNRRGVVGPVVAAVELLAEHQDRSGLHFSNTYGPPHPEARHVTAPPAHAMDPAVTGAARTMQSLLERPMPHNAQVKEPLPPPAQHSAVNVPWLHRAPATVRAIIPPTSAAVASAAAAAASTAGANQALAAAAQPQQHSLFAQHSNSNVEASASALAPRSAHPRVQPLTAAVADSALGLHDAAAASLKKARVHATSAATAVATAAAAVLAAQKLRNEADAAKAATSTGPSAAAPATGDAGAIQLSTGGVPPPGTTGGATGDVPAAPAAPALITQVPAAPTAAVVIKLPPFSAASVVASQAFQYTQSSGAQEPLLGNAPGLHNRYSAALGVALQEAGVVQAGQSAALMQQQQQQAAQGQQSDSQAGGAAAGVPAVTSLIQERLYELVVRMTSQSTEVRGSALAVPLPPTLAANIAVLLRPAARPGDAPTASSAAPGVVAASLGQGALAAATNKPNLQPAAGGAVPGGYVTSFQSLAVSRADPALGPQALVGAQAATGVAAAAVMASNVAAVGTATGAAVMSAASSGRDGSGQLTRNFEHGAAYLLVHQPAQLPGRQPHQQHVAAPAAAAAAVAVATASAVAHNASVVVCAADAPVELSSAAAVAVDGEAVSGRGPLIAAGRGSRPHAEPLIAPLLQLVPVEGVTGTAGTLPPIPAYAQAGASPAPPQTKGQKAELRAVIVARDEATRAAACAHPASFRTTRTLAVTGARDPAAAAAAAFGASILQSAAYAVPLAALQPPPQVPPAAATAHTQQLPPLPLQAPAPVRIAALSAAVNGDAASSTQQPSGLVAAEDGEGAPASKRRRVAVDGCSVAAPSTTVAAANVASADGATSETAPARTHAVEDKVFLSLPAWEWEGALPPGRVAAILAICGVPAAAKAGAVPSLVAVDGLAVVEDIAADTCATGFKRRRNEAAPSPETAIFPAAETPEGLFRHRGPIGGLVTLPGVRVGAGGVGIKVASASGLGGRFPELLAKARAALNHAQQGGSALTAAASTSGQQGGGVALAAAAAALADVLAAAALPSASGVGSSALVSSGGGAGVRQRLELVAAHSKRLKQKLAPSRDASVGSSSIQPPRGSALPAPAPPVVPVCGDSSAFSSSSSSSGASPWSVAEDLLLLRTVAEFGCNWDVVREVVRGASLPLPLEAATSALLSVATPVSAGPEALAETLRRAVAQAPGMRIGPTAALTSAASRLRPVRSSKACYDRYRRLLVRPLNVSVVLPTRLLQQPRHLAGAAGAAAGSDGSASGAATAADPAASASADVDKAAAAAQASLASTLFHTLRRHDEARRARSGGGGLGARHREDVVSAAAAAVASALGFGGGIVPAPDGRTARFVVGTVQPLASTTSALLRAHMGTLAHAAGAGGGAGGAGSAPAMSLSTRMLPLGAGLYHAPPTAAAYASPPAAASVVCFGDAATSAARRFTAWPPPPPRCPGTGTGGAWRDALVCYAALPVHQMRLRPTWRLALNVISAKGLRPSGGGLNPLGAVDPQRPIGAPSAASRALALAAVDAAFGAGVGLPPVAAVVPRSPSALAPFVHTHRAHTAALPFGASRDSALLQLTRPPPAPGAPGSYVPGLSHPYGQQGPEPFRRSSPYIAALRQRERDRIRVQESEVAAYVQAQQQQAAAALAQQQQQAAQLRQQLQQQAAAAAAAQAAAAAAAQAAAVGAAAASTGSAVARSILQKVVSNPGLASLGVPREQLLALVSQLLTEPVIAEIERIGTQPGLQQAQADEATMRVILAQLQAQGSGGALPPAPIGAGDAAPVGKL